MSKVIVACSVAIACLAVGLVVGLFSGLGASPGDAAPTSSPTPVTGEEAEATAGTGSGSGSGSGDGGTARYAGMLDKFEGTWEFRPSTGMAAYRTWVIDGQGNVVVRKGRETPPGEGKIAITAADGESATARITTHTGEGAVRHRYRLTQRRDGAWDMTDARTGEGAGYLMYT